MKEPTLMVVVVGLLSASILPAVPAAADSLQAIPTVGPGVCEGRKIMLNEGEILEERTLYFRGDAPVGNVDGWQSNNIVEGHGPRLSPHPPTASEDKIYVSQSTGSASSHSATHGYWWRQQDGDERIVCAEARVIAATTTGELSMHLFLDQPKGANQANARLATGSAPANEVGDYAVNFGDLDVTAADNVVLQVGPAQVTQGGALRAVVFYDSVGRPSRLDYVVVCVPGAWTCTP